MQYKKRYTINEKDILKEHIKVLEEQLRDAQLRVRELNEKILKSKCKCNQ